MYAASSAIEGRDVPAVNRPGPYLPFLNKISISADGFFSTQADPGRWNLGSAQPATVPGVRLPEPILRLKD